MPGRNIASFEVVSSRRFAAAAVWALCLAPAVLEPGAGSFGLAGLGRACGVLGLSCLLMAGVTAVRLPGLDVRFGGLSRLWKLHHLLGASAFLLLLAHPLLLSLAAARVSPRAAADVLLPPASDGAAWTGWAALALMSVFLAPTFRFFGKPDYQRWKALHALSAAAIALALAHAAAASRPPRAWAGLGALAALALVYRFVVAPRARRRFIVSRVDRIARGVVELSLTPEGGPGAHRAGQFVYLTPLDPGLAAGRGEEHPYTISSVPGETALRVVVKDLGDASRALQGVAVGSEALVEGPFGDFFPKSVADAPELWIAGGVGLTPFLARARALSGPCDVRLIYCVQDESRAHFAAELDAIAARVPGFVLIRHYFAVEGRLDAAFLRARCPDAPSRDVFVCGPPPLIRAARDAARAAGVPPGRVHSEDFDWL